MRLRIVILINFLFLIGLPARGPAQSNAPVRLNVSCRDASLRDVLSAIGIQHGVSLAGLGAVTGNVTIHLDDVPLDEGLRALLEPQGYTYEKHGNIYYIQRQPPETARVTLTVTDGKLTIDANNADVNQVISTLNAQSKNTPSKINITAAPNLVGAVTAHLTDVPIADGIQAMFTGDNFTLNEINGIYQVGGRQTAQGPGLAVFVSNGLVSIQANEASLTQLLAAVAERAKINLATVGNVERRVTLRLSNKPLEEALGDIALMTGNSYRKVGDIYFIGKGVVQPGEENPLLERKILWLNHLEATDAITLLPADIPKQNLTVSLERNALIVVGTADVIKRTEEVIAELDIDTDAIRTRQQWAIAVDVDGETGRLAVDVKDAPIELVVREVSIRTGIDVLILGETGGGTLATRRVSRRVRGTLGAAQQAQAQTQSQSQSQQSALASLPRGAGTLRNTVTLRLADATLDEVLAALFKGTGYTYKLEQQGDKALYIVGTGELTSGQTNPLVVSKQIPLKYLDVTKIADVLPPTVQETNITIIPDQNALMVMGVPEMVEQLESYLAQIDVPTPQVMIQVYLLELTHGSRQELGLTFDGGKDRTTINLAPGFGLSFDTLARVPEAFQTTLTALINANRGRVLANPLVAVISGEQATIDVSTTTYFETPTEIYRGVDVPVGGYTRRGFNEIKTGIQLEITPWIGAAGEITMAIKPQVSSGDIAREQSTVSERSVDTVIRVKDQGMIVIGGLLQEKEGVLEDKIPVLHHIPLLGKLLFTNRSTSSEQTELIVIIEPKVIH